jgi:hypothetical protein
VFFSSAGAWPSSRMSQLTAFSSRRSAAAGVLRTPEPPNPCRGFSALDARTRRRRGARVDRKDDRVFLLNRSLISMRTFPKRSTKTRRYARTANCWSRSHESAEAPRHRCLANSLLSKSFGTGKRWRHLSLCPRIPMRELRFSVVSFKKPATRTHVEYSTCRRSRRSVQSCHHRFCLPPARQRQATQADHRGRDAPAAGPRLRRAQVGKALRSGS